MDKRECTVKEVCKYYGLTRTTIERYRRQGMPFLRKGRRVYFIVADVEKWFKEKNKEIKYNYENTPSN